jgi:hypothetical protein
MRPWLVTFLAIGCAALRAPAHASRADEATMFVFDHACGDPRTAARLVLPNDRLADFVMPDPRLKDGLVSADRGYYTPETLVAAICNSLVHSPPGTHTDLRVVGAVVVGPAGSDQGIRPGAVAQIVHFVLQTPDGERSQFSHDLVWIQTPDGWQLAWIQ